MHRNGFQKQLKTCHAHLSHRFFTRCFFVMLGALCLLAGGYVSYYDPLLVTGFENAANRIVPVIDARMQKTNKLLRYQADYDALLIGSSRVEQFRQEDFAPLKTFNYAMPSIYPDEYGAYIDLFLKTNRNKAPVIFLGFDFYGSNGIFHDHAKPPDYYIGMCSSLFYVPGVLFSKDTFDFAHRMASGKRDVFSYDRKSLDKINAAISPATAASYRQTQLKTYESTCYGKYVYNSNYRETLRDIKARLTGSRFVIFTTPESDELFRMLVAKGLMDNYEQWLTDLVTTFGGVHHFMRPGRFAANHDNFIDSHHLFPEKAAPLAHLISGKAAGSNDELSDSFITNANIKQHLTQIRHDAENLVKEHD